MSKVDRELYEFDTFRLDVAERLLSREGERVPLSEKAFDTLCVLVRRGNRLVRKDELLNEVWPDAIVEENNLDKSISLLRQVLGERTGKGKYIETVRGHGFRFVPEVRVIEEDEIGKKPSREEVATVGGSLLSHAEESSNWSVTEPKATSGTPEPGIRTPRAKPLIADRRFLLVALGTLIVAGVIGVYFWQRSSPNATTKTIAVLPFKSLVAEERDEALELGMADALISKLSEAEEITVRPLSAVRRYDSPDQDSIAAGRQLNVEAVLDGSFQTSGDRIRVMARLVRVSDGKQLWASRLEEKFTDIFRVQDSISERVATVLKIRLTNKENRRYTDNFEAYEHYMKGRFHALRLTRAETDKAVANFQQAILLDPNYALPYLGLAAAYLPMALTSGLPSSEVIPKAKEAALRAVEIDPGNSEGYVILGLISFWYDWDWQAAEKHYQQALDLDPKSAEAHFAYAHLLSNSGRHERALAEIKLARELDPLSLRTNAAEGQMLFFAKDYDNALDRLQKTIDLDPNFWLSHLFISRVYTEKGMHSEAVAEAKKAAELSGNSQSDAYRAYALAKWGKPSEARVVLNELLKSSTETYVPPYNIALAYNAVGERARALDYLEKGFAERDVRMVFLRVESQWDGLRSEPRFVELIKRMRIG
jgi:DNA-binding winged helix-turn-helix (wHTH) protein/TolB-like protein/Tfp pilus assembly protein PilF